MGTKFVLCTNMVKKSNARKLKVGIRVIHVIMISYNINYSYDMDEFHSACKTF